MNRRRRCTEARLATCVLSKPKSRRMVLMSDMLTFDAALLHSRLAKLPREARVAFALACAERLQPYATFSNDASAVELVRRILDLTFAAISSPSIPRPELAQLSQALEAAPYLDDDAAASAAYALRCYFSSDAKDAFFAAQRAYDARDREAQQLIASNVITVADERVILAHPNVQQEFARQRADLDALEASHEGLGTTVLRARNDARRG
jgi:Protein of unknown function (DUF416)